MKLIELLPFIDEYTEVCVYNDTDDGWSELVAWYDGRNSIPEKYNECTITTVKALTDYAIAIHIEGGEPND